MNFKKNMTAAIVLTALTIVLFVVASPLVPIAPMDVWIWLALIVGAAAAGFWISALQSRAVEETGSTDF